jgi:antitoxin ParD1/3/4
MVYLNKEHIMAKNTSIILGEHYDNFIQQEIKSGRYSTASEIIRHGLRLMEVEKNKIDSINKALVVGEESGQARPFDNNEFKSRMRKKFNVE